MKGQANIMLAVIFFTVFAIALAPLILSIYGLVLTQSPYTPAHSQLNLREVSGDIIALYDEPSKTLILANRGGEDIEVDRIIAQYVCNGVPYTISIDKSKMPGILTSGTTIQLSTQELLALNCSSPYFTTIYIVTLDGYIIKAKIFSTRIIEDIRRLTSESNYTFTEARTFEIIPVNVGPGDNLSSTTELLASKGFIVQPINEGMTGGTRGNRYTWVLNYVSLSNVTISINNQAGIGCIWLGYDPRDPSKYNIVITSNGITMNLLPGGTIQQSGYVRVKIYGFKPLTNYIMQLKEIIEQQQQIIQQIININTVDSNIASYMFLNTPDRNTTLIKLYGTAERVEIYVRSPANASSYNPYLMLMSTIKVQGKAQLLFATEDYMAGDSSTINDYDSELLDASIIPLRLVYKGLVISNDLYTAVMIAVNYRFHDNEGEDFGGVTADYPIFRVGLVDENGNEYSFRVYAFRELTRYEDTYPPVAQAQSSIIFIPLPDVSVGVKKYYVFIEIQDPYWYSGETLDDLDFSLYIESLVVITIPR